MTRHLLSLFFLLFQRDLVQGERELAGERGRGGVRAGQIILLQGRPVSRTREHETHSRQYPNDCKLNLA